MSDLPRYGNQSPVARWCISAVAEVGQKTVGR